MKEGQDLMGKIDKMRMNFRAAIAKKVEEYKAKQAEEERIQK